MRNFNPLDWAREFDAAADFASLKTIANRIGTAAGIPLFCYTELGNRYRRHE